MVSCGEVGGKVSGMGAGKLCGSLWESQKLAAVAAVGVGNRRFSTRICRINMRGLRESSGAENTFKNIENRNCRRFPHSLLLQLLNI